MTDEPNPSNDQGPLIQWDVNRAAIAAVAEELKDVDAHKDLAVAKKAKKKLVGMRGELTEYHKATKAKALAFGKLCDSEKNALMELIRAIEDPISNDIDEIKNAAAKAEEERVAKIQAELDRIEAFSNDRHSLTLAELEERLETLRAVELDKELLEEYIEDAHLAKQEADLKLRLAIDREKEEAKEREEKAELERKNQELQDQIDKTAADQKVKDDAAKAEQDEKDRVAKEESDAAAAEQKEKDDARQKELDDQQAEIDRQNKEKADAEQAELDAKKREADEIEAQKIRDLQAPDIEKLTKYADAIDHLIGLKPIMGSTNGNAVMLDVVHGLVGVHQLLENHIEEMK